MEPVTILLVIPFVAFLMLRVNQQRKEGLDPESRNANRGYLKITACAMVGIAVFLTFCLVDGVLNSVPGLAPILLTLARALLVGLCGIFAWRTWQVSTYEEQPDLPLSEVVRRDQIDSSATAMGMILIMLPLAIPALILSSTVLLIPLLVFCFSMTSSRAHQCQLLWTLAVGVKGDLDLGREVDELYISMKPRRPLLRKVLTAGFMIIGTPAVVPLIIGIPILISMYRYNRFLKNLEQLANNLHNGTPLHAALEVQPNLLSPDIVGAIESASQAGNLKEVLPKIAMEQSQEMEEDSQGTSIMNVMMYSWMIVCVAVATVYFIMIFIVPKFKAIFLDFGVELPILTETVIEFSDLFVNYWFIGFPLIFAPFLIPLVTALLLSNSRTFLPRQIVNFFPRLETSPLLKRLSHAVRQNFPIQESLHSLANSTPDYRWARRLERLEDRLNSGDRIGTAMQEEKLLNTRETHSLHNAEEIGHLAWAMESIADSIDDRQKTRSRWVAELVRPFITLTLSLIVALFCVGMFMPLVKLLSELGEVL